MDLPFASGTFGANGRLHGSYPEAGLWEIDSPRCSKRGVPAVYLTSVNSQFLSFSSFNEINMLRVISQGQNSDSPRLHQTHKQII